MKEGDQVRLINTRHVRTVDRITRAGLIVLRDAINGRHTFDPKDLKAEPPPKPSARKRK